MPSSVNIVFTNTKKANFVSLAIKLFIWAPYNHVALEMNEHYFEAVGDGAHWTSREHFLATKDIRAKFSIQLNELQSSRLCTAIDEYEGTPYDFRAVLGLALVRLGWKHNPMANGAKKLFCSELVYNLLVDCDVIQKTTEPELLDPKRLLRYLENSKNPAVSRLF